MNKEMLTSVVRQILFLIGGALGIEAFNNESFLVALASVIVTVITSAWALWTRTDKSIVATAAAKVPVSEKSQEAVGIAVPVKPKTA